MPDYSKKISILTVLILLAVFFFGFARASLWDVIKAWVTINPLVVDVSAPAEVEINKVFKLEARVANKGEEKIEDARGEIFLPPELVLIQKDSAKEIGVIPGKKEKKISWSVKGKAIGNYIVSVKVSGELKGQIISAEDSTLVEVKEFIRETESRKWLQNFFDFFQERFGF